MVLQGGILLIIGFRRSLSPPLILISAQGSSRVNDDFDSTCSAEALPEGGRPHGAQNKISKQKNTPKSYDLNLAGVTISNKVLTAPAYGGQGARGGPVLGVFLVGELSLTERSGKNG